MELQEAREQAEQLAKMDDATYYVFQDNQDSNCFRVISHDQIYNVMYKTEADYKIVAEYNGEGRIKFDYPIYGGDNSEAPSGLYLGLFHGRDNANDDMEDWGFNGPMIGPLEYVHTTYGSDIKLSFVNAEDARKYYPWGLWEHCGHKIVEYVDDMVRFHDQFYGDITVFNHTKGGETIHNSYS